MSVFSSQTSWTGMCSGANQSPINLSQSIAKPCKLSCDLKIEDTNTSSGNLLITDEGLVLSGTLGSCKFRDATYICQTLIINHPSHHTVEGVQADGEITAIFVTPTSEVIAVSSLFRVSSSPTPSLNFFKQIVPYAQPSQTKVQLNDWSLQQMVPSDGAYFVYDGSTIIPPCKAAEVIVYKTMINMDQTDFAYLTKNIQAGSRSIQALGDRQVFFNELSDTGFLPHDNKTYMVLKPLKASRPVTTKIDKTDLKTTQALENAKEPSTVSTISQNIYENRDDYLSMFFTLFFIGGAFFLLYRLKDDLYYLTHFFNWWRGVKSHVIL